MVLIFLRARASTAEGAPSGISEQRLRSEQRDPRPLGAAAVLERDGALAHHPGGLVVDDLVELVPRKARKVCIRLFLTQIVYRIYMTLFEHFLTLYRMYKTFVDTV